ncbi:MAG TPA: VOC family protein [Candidatus Eisenbacteria bacterium]|nr:VOC family protein [Candidatus Eisenbacteria bacterium]
MRNALLVCLAFVLASPAESAERSRLEATGGAFFALSVPNMAESVAWYTSKLGLSPTMEIKEPVEVTVLEGGGLIVELVRHSTAQPLVTGGASRAEVQHGFFKAGFVVKDFDKTVEELRARGVTFAFGPFPASPTQRANVVIRDNANNLIQIFGPGQRPSK